MATSVYNHIQSSEQTRDLHTLLDRYANERAQVVKNPEEIWDWLAFDPTCRYNLARGNILTYSSCAQCQNMDRFVKLLDYNMDEPFIVESGSLKGKTLKIVDMGIVSPTIKEQSYPLDIEQHFMASCPEYGKCDAALNTKKYIALDRLSHYLIISFILQHIFQEAKMGAHFQTTYTGFVCGDHGYVLQEDWPELVEASQVELQERDIPGVLTQMLNILRLLSQYQFTSTGIRFAWLKKPWKRTPYTLVFMLQPSFALTWKNIRYYNDESQKSRYGLSLAQHISKFDILPKEDGVYYRFTPNTIQLFYHMRNRGVPVFVQSTDFYLAYLYLLVSTPDFRALAWNLVSGVWWNEEQKAMIAERIPYISQSSDMDVFLLLATVSLSCSVLEKIKF